MKRMIVASRRPDFDPDNIAGTDKVSKMLAYSVDLLCNFLENSLHLDVKTDYADYLRIRTISIQAFVSYEEFPEPDDYDPGEGQARLNEYGYDLLEQCKQILERKGISGIEFVDVRTAWNVQGKPFVLITLKKKGDGSKGKWAIIKDNLSIEDDPLYYGTESGEYIISVCTKVEKSLNLYVEPSVQAGTGSVWIYDESNNDKCVLSGYDYMTFNDNILDLVFQSKNVTEFKSAYKEYLLSIIKKR